MHAGAHRAFRAWRTAGNGLEKDAAGKAQVMLTYHLAEACHIPEAVAHRIIRNCYEWQGVDTLTKNPIRSASHDASASIYIRITEGRGAQFRFNTGHRLNKASSWNAKTRSVRSVACESYELLNLQLRRLESMIEAKAIEAKSKKLHRSILKRATTCPVE